MINAPQERTVPIAEDRGDPDDWFDRLPEDYRAQVLEGRLEREVHWEVLVRRARREWRRPVGEATALFLLVCLPIVHFSWPGLLVIVIAGALVGWTWHLSRAGQLLAPLIAMPVCLGVLLLVGGTSYLVVFCAPFPLGAISAWLGSQRYEPD